MQSFLADQSKVFLGRDTGVHHHRRWFPEEAKLLSCLYPQSIKHLFECRRLTHIAGKHLARFRKTVFIQNQAQGDQGTVGSLLLRSGPVSLRALRSRSGQVSIGQIIEDDLFSQTIKLLLVLAQLLLDDVMVCIYLIGYPIQSIIR